MFRRYKRLTSITRLSSSSGKHDVSYHHNFIIMSYKQQYFPAGTAVLTGKYYSIDMEVLQTPQQLSTGNSKSLFLFRR